MIFLPLLICSKTAFSSSGVKSKPSLLASAVWKSFFISIYVETIVASGTIAVIWAFDKFIILSRIFWWFFCNVSLKSGSLYSNLFNSLSKPTSDFKDVSIAFTISVINFEVGPKSSKASFNNLFLNATAKSKVITSTSSSDLGTSFAWNFSHSFFCFSRFLKASIIVWALLSSFFCFAPDNFFSSSSTSADKSSS